MEKEKLDADSKMTYKEMRDILNSLSRKKSYKKRMARIKKEVLSYLKKHPKCKKQYSSPFLLYQDKIRWGEEGKPPKPIYVGELNSFNPYSKGDADIIMRFKRDAGHYSKMTIVFRERKGGYSIQTMYLDKHKEAWWHFDMMSQVDDFLKRARHVRFMDLIK